MSNGNEPAYPTADPNYESKYAGAGLTKREAFAMAAMQGLCSNTALYDERVMKAVVAESGRGIMTPAGVVAMLAVRQADALLAELAKDQK